MNLVITFHLRRRMAQRGITEEDVRAALARHHTSYPTLEQSVCYIGPGIDGRDLKVWIVLPGLSADPAIVKSAAWKDNHDD